MQTRDNRQIENIYEQQNEEGEEEDNNWNRFWVIDRGSLRLHGRLTNASKMYDELKKIAQWMHVYINNR